MILSSATTPLLGMVDTAVVGHLDEPYYLGGVATGATIFTVLFMGLNFLRMGTTGLTAQAYGAQRGDEVRQDLGQALLTALALAVAMILLRPLIIDVALLALGAEPGSGGRHPRLFRHPRLQRAGLARELRDRRLAARHAERPRAAGADARHQRDEHRSRLDLRPAARDAGEGRRARHAPRRVGRPRRRPRFRAPRARPLPRPLATRGTARSATVTGGSLPSTATCCCAPCR